MCKYTCFAYETRWNNPVFSYLEEKKEVAIVDSETERDAPEKYIIEPERPSENFKDSGDIETITNDVCDDISPVQIDDSPGEGHWLYGSDR